MSGTPAATATGRSTLFRSAPTAGLVAYAFDPDDGKEQDGAPAFACGATHGWSQPPRSRIRRKLDDGAHMQFSLVAADMKLAGDVPIKNRTWLTAC